MSKLLAKIAIFCIIASTSTIVKAATAPVAITDTLHNLDGTSVAGTVYITNPAFFDASNTLVPANTLVVPVTGGNLSVSLVPTSNATTPNVLYTVSISALNGPPQGTTTFYWAVPSSCAPCTISQVQTSPFTASGFLSPPVNFAALPTCNAGNEGNLRAVKDSNTVTWGATIAGSSTNHVLGYCDGTNWTVAAK